MTQNTTVSLVEDTWTQLTDGDVTAITFQVQRGDDVLVKGTVGAVAPTDNDGAVLYNTGQGEKNATLADLFPGVAATRVYANSLSGEGRVMVSNA